MLDLTIQQVIVKIQKILLEKLLNQLHNLINITLMLDLTIQQVIVKTQMILLEKLLKKQHIILHLI